MKQFNVEYAVGLFMLAGLLSLFWLAMELGGVASAGSDTYILRARFVSASGLKPGADVEVAGVVVGQVERVSFIADDYQAEVEMSLAKDVRLQDDAIASIRSTGIIGGKFLKITPGGSDMMLSADDEIRETESSVNFEELLSKYIFSSDSK
jgi:phospholipid/cholesterol/gamma-HCH transport system substrate-binding protein